MAGVETVKLTNNSAAAINFDASGVTDATKYVLGGTNGVISLSDVATLVDLEVTAPASVSTFTAAYVVTSTVATGTQTDTQNLKVTNVGTIDSDNKTSTANANLMDIVIANVEALAITTAGTANTFNF